MTNIMQYALMIEFIPRPNADKMDVRLTARKNQVSLDNLHMITRQIDQLVELVTRDILAPAQDAKHELATILPALTKPAVSVSGHDLLFTAFDRRVARTPSLMAIEYIDDASMVHGLTYADVGKRIDTITRSLRSLHLKHSTPIIVMMSKVPELFLVFMAILKAGLVYTPLAPDTPGKRLDFILHDLRPGLILVDNVDLAKTLQKYSVDLPRVLSLEEVLALQSNTGSMVSVSPDDLSYIIYTSGSTGGPKAVMVSHSAAVATINSSESILDLGTSSKWLQFASLTFDMSIYDMCIAFSFGICLCGAPKSLLLSDLTSVIQRLEITHLDLTPSVARTLRCSELPSVALLFCIGERLGKSIIEEWGSKCVNVYGPTEAAMACTSHRVGHESIAQNIGTPFTHVQIAIFSPDTDDLLSHLFLGELCISGPQLCKGYLHNDEKNATSFFTHTGRRYYRTGDLCRLLGDDSIAFVGRKDFQAKLRGQRIELDEISSELITQIEGVSDASTIIQPFPGQDLDQLISFVSSCSRISDSALPCHISQSNTIEFFQQAVDTLGQSLPIYMIPAHVINLNYIPLNTAQKVDRSLLQDLWRQYTEQSFGAVDHRTEEEYSVLELTVRTIISDISGVEPLQIHRQTSIYNLGLDSISAIQVVAALKKQGYSLSVIDVLRNTTLDRLAKRLELISAGPQPGPTKSIAAQPSSQYVQLCQALQSFGHSGNRILPCTPAQENMIAQFIKTQGQAYYNHVLFELDTELDLERLQSAWATIVQSFDILRAKFLAVDQKGCQYALEVPSTVKHSFCSIEKVLDLQNVVEHRIESLTTALLNDLGRQSCEVAIFDSGTARSMLFSAHHAIYDGNTLEVLFSDLAKIYRGQPIVRYEPLETSIPDLWSIYHDEGRQEKSANYWKQTMAKSNFTPFPNLNNRIDQSTAFTVETHTLVLPLSSIESQCRSHGVTFSTLAMSAWAKLLSAYTGEAAATFGVVLSGRTGTDLDSALCPCITTVPAPFLLDGTVQSIWDHFERFSVSVLEHQHTPLSKIRREDSSTLFDSIFVYQKRDTSSLTNELWKIGRDIAAVEIPLSIEVLAKSDLNRCDLVLTYQAAKVPEKHAGVILSQIESIICAMLERPKHNILDLETLLPQEQLSILYPKNPIFETPVKLVHEFVEWFASHTPDAVAFEFTEDLEERPHTWTYRQLEEKANQLARHLLTEIGLHGSAPIAVCFFKCPEAFISILAVLKTGSPFCCLDSSAPIDRRKFIIENSGSMAVLCGPEFELEFKDAACTRVVVISELEQLTTDNSRIKIEMSDKDLCYILYTSGSTGVPKGCCLSHRSVTQSLAAFQIEFMGQFDNNSRFLAFASLHFDVSILETYFSWSIGARVCAAPKDVLLSDIPGVSLSMFYCSH